MTVVCMTGWLAQLWPGASPLCWPCSVWWQLCVWQIDMPICDLVLAHCADLVVCDDSCVCETDWRTHMWSSVSPSGPHSVWWWLCVTVRLTEMWPGASSLWWPCRVSPCDDSCVCVWQIDLPKCDLVLALHDDTAVYDDSCGIVCVSDRLTCPSATWC